MKRPISPMLACLLACASLSTIAATEAPPIELEQALTLRVDGELTIDPNGVPTSYVVQTPLPQALAVSLQRQVHSWRFDPILIDGKPVTAKAWMHVTLGATGADDAMNVSVENVTFPQKTGAVPDQTQPVNLSCERPGTPPVYPRDELFSGTEARVAVQIEVGLDGTVQRASIAQTSLLQAGDAVYSSRSKIAHFEKATLKAAKTWQCQVTTQSEGLALLQSDPQAYAKLMTVTLPVEFLVKNISVEDRRGWQQEFRTVKRATPWLKQDANEQVVGVNDVASGEIAMAGTRFHLTTVVVGATL